MQQPLQAKGFCSDEQSRRDAANGGAVALPMCQLSLKKWEEAFEGFTRGGKRGHCPSANTFAALDANRIGEHQPKLIEAAMQCGAFVAQLIIFVQTRVMRGLDCGPQ